MLGFLGTVTGSGTRILTKWRMPEVETLYIYFVVSGGYLWSYDYTVGGLIVGIIAMFAYNYLVMLVDRVVNKMESRTMEFMDLLNEPAK